MPQSAVRTYLFADLRDFTAFVEAQGDTAATRLIGGFRRIVRETIRGKGAEIRTEGDSFYIVFDTPGTAVRAAVRIQRRCLAYNESRPDRPIRVGMGINTGEAVEHDGGYVGAAVIIASRIASQAGAGTIIATEAVRSLVRGARVAAFRDLGTWALKGVTEAIHVHEVEVAAQHVARSGLLPLPALLRPTQSASAVGVVLCPSIVDRDLELAALGLHLTAAARGESRLVALVGEAGVGKTRLVRETAERASAQGFTVLAGQAHARGAVVYEALSAALRPYVRARGLEVLRRLLGGLTSEISRIAPELETGAPLPSLADDERRERFYRLVQLVLEDAASQRPVLLVVEDLHDADAGTRDLIAYLAANVRSGLCIVLTFRTESLARDAALRATMAELDRERRLARIDVRPLDASAVTRMTRLMMPAPTRTLCEAVFERSRGLPFYVEELVRTAVDRGTGDVAHDMPRGIRDSVELRVERLVDLRGEPVARLLELLALAGVPLAYDVLARLDGRGDDAAGADIAAAIDAQILERAATQRAYYQYRHPLTREAIEARVPPERGRVLHLRIAETLEGSPGAEPSLLARHFALGGNAPKAYRYGMVAGRRAYALGAYADATAALEETARSATTDADRAEVFELLGRVLHAAGRPSEAEATLERARAEAMRAGDVRSAARIDVAIARAARALGRRAEAERAVRSAMDELDGTDLAEALIVGSELAWAVNDMARATALAEAAHELAERAGDQPLAVAALTALGSAAIRAGSADAVAVLERAVRAATAAGLPAEAASAWFELSRAHLLRGEFRPAATAAGSGLKVAREHGLEVVQTRLLAQLTTIHINHGEYALARETAEQAVALARPGTLAADAARISLGHVLANQGEFEAARAIFDELADRVEGWDVDRRVTYHAYRAQGLLGAREPELAERSAREALRITLANPGMGMTAFLNAAGVIEARRDAEAARELAVSFERYFAARSTGPIEAVRLEIAAVVEWCERRPAGDAFARTAEAYDAIGARVHALYRRASSAIARLEARDGTARRELRELRRTLAERAAARYVALIDDAVQRPRARARSQPMLRGRDLRVAVLLAHGAGDTRIARELGVSQSEAARRVRAVLRSLGVESRSQVASWAMTRAMTRVAGERVRVT